jgi:hypothetical protein
MRAIGNRANPTIQKGTNSTYTLLREALNLGVDNLPCSTPLKKMQIPTYLRLTNFHGIYSGPTKPLYSLR